MRKLTYGTNRNLRIATKTIGGKVVGSMVTGLISQERALELPQRAQRRIKALAPRLLASH
jgi:hypothetical protein